MTLHIDIHVIQSVPPSNLNRDDTGAPKDAIFGGFRRARLSSQAQKRPVRRFFRESRLIAPQHLGLRTKKVMARLSEMLLTRGREAPDNAIRQALAAIHMKLDDKGEAQYLLFLAEDELARFADLIDRHWDALNIEADGKKSKKDAKSTLPKEVIAEASRILDGGRAADIALFGRMLADLPGANQDAACQVAHSISTHAVERQFDYFTAVDDLATPEESGAAMIDNVEFNSATHYRYAALDPLKLLANLQGDEELALASVRAFIEAFACTLPSGKQNSFAAHNPPAFVGVVLRQKMPINLANAFEQPVFPQRDRALSALSVERLAHQEKTLAQAYGEEGPWAVLDLTGAWDAGGTAVVKLADLAEWAARQAAERYAARG